MVYIDEQTLKEWAEFSKSVFLENCVVPIKIYWTDDSLGYQSSNLYCIAQEAKSLTLSENTILLNGIPVGQWGVWLDVNDQIDLDSMSETEKNSIRFVLYHNTKNPINILPDLSNIKISYFLDDFRFEESVRYIGEKV